MAIVTGEEADIVEEDERNDGCNYNQATAEPAGHHPEKIEYTKQRIDQLIIFSPEQCLKIDLFPPLLLTKRANYWGKVGAKEDRRRSLPLTHRDA